MRKNLTRIRIKKRRKVLIIGICILYNYETECNYIFKRYGKGLY